MGKWFECKVKYSIAFGENEDPKQAERKETYLIDALSFTEAEARVIKKVTPFVVGELEIQSVSKRNINEIVFNEDENADRWYKCKVLYITLEDDVEKETATTWMVKAGDIEGALTHLNKVGMKGFQGDYWISQIIETKIMDVLPYEAPEEEKK